MDSFFFYTLYSFFLGQICPSRGRCNDVNPPTNYLFSVRFWKVLVALNDSCANKSIKCIILWQYSQGRASEGKRGDGVRGTPLYGLYGDVPLDRVWFLPSMF